MFNSVVVEIRGGAEPVAEVRVVFAVVTVVCSQRIARVDVPRQRPWQDHPSRCSPNPCERQWGEVAIDRQVSLEPAHRACIPAQGVGDDRQWSGGQARACFGHGVVRCRKSSGAVAADDLGRVVHLRAVRWPKPLFEQECRLVVGEQPAMQLHAAQKLEQGGTKGKRGGSRVLQAKPFMKPFFFFFDTLGRRRPVRAISENVQRRICGHWRREERERHSLLLRFPRSSVDEPAQRGCRVLHLVVGEFQSRFMRNVEAETILPPMRAGDYHPDVVGVTKLNGAEHEGMIDWGVQASVAPVRI